MSALCLQLLTILCLSCTALSGQESGGVLWKHFGGAITIHCRTTELDPYLLTLKRGLKEDHILATENSTETKTINKEFIDRLQLNGTYPNIDIKIKNLTFEDTGPFWCYYTKITKKPRQVMETKGTGSILLVVTDTEKQCDPASKDLVLVSVVIIGAVLFGIIIGFLMWIILKTKILQCTGKPRPVASNDVYEDMRSTLRR